MRIDKDWHYGFDILLTKDSPKNYVCNVVATPRKDFPAYVKPFVLSYNMRCTFKAYRNNGEVVDDWHVDRLGQESKGLSDVINVDANKWDYSMKWKMESGESQNVFTFSKVWDGLHFK